MYDDEVDCDEANDDEPNPEEFQSLDNSGWSSRTRGVARYLKTLFDEESGLGRKSVAIDHLLSGKTRKEASRMFFETLVLTTKDFISVDQPNSFDFVSVKPGPKLLKSDF
jgi:cohesin complex subunit SCC1